MVFFSAERENVLARIQHNSFTSSKCLCRRTHARTHEQKFGPAKMASLEGSQLDLEEEEGVHTALIDSLLNLVSRAHALVAELLRLSHRVSPILFNEAFYSRYKDVLFDFEYLKVS